MRSELLIEGRMRHHDAPDWAALEALLGADELCAHFMWMHDVVLEDGTILHAWERLLPFVSEAMRYRFATTHVPGVAR